MFEIGAGEVLVIVIVAVIVIGPKDLPVAMRTAGRWIGKMRRISGHFRAGIDAMVRDAELEEMERKWRAQNARIMRDHPHATPDEMTPTGAYPPKPVPGGMAPGAESPDVNASGTAGASGSDFAPSAASTEAAGSRNPAASPPGAGT